MSQIIRETVREIDLDFMHKIFPKPEWDWSVSTTRKGGVHCWAIHVEHDRGSATAHAFDLEEIPLAAQRAKDYVLALPGGAAGNTNPQDGQPSG